MCQLLQFGYNFLLVSEKLLRYLEVFDMFFLFTTFVWCFCGCCLVDCHSNCLFQYVFSYSWFTKLCFHYLSWNTYFSLRTLIICVLIWLSEISLEWRLLLTFVASFGISGIAVKIIPCKW